MERRFATAATWTSNTYMRHELKGGVMAKRYSVALEFVAILVASAAIAWFIATFGEAGLYNIPPLSVVNYFGHLLFWVFLPGVLGVAMLFGNVHDVAYASYLAGASLELLLLWSIFRRRRICEVFHGPAKVGD